MFAGGRVAHARPTDSSEPEVARHVAAVGSLTGTRGPLKHPHRLSFYEQPPLDEITVEQFEEWAIDRLRLLADIEAAQARNKSFEEMKTIVLDRSKQFLPLSSNTAKGANLDAERQKDLYSHFVLRLAFCRSEELRHRFVRAETTLFKIRWSNDDNAERNEFVRSLAFGWHKVDAEEKEALKDDLAALLRVNPERVAAEAFFKVDWQQVTDLVALRRIYLRAGKAYVHTKEELSLVAAEFQSRLLRGLEMTAKALPRLDEDSRLLPVLEHLSLGFQAGISSEYSFVGATNGEQVTAHMVPALARHSFPFCMRSLQQTLEESKHLKHNGRQQYNLFLKGIGLSVEEAVAFWRTSFKLVTDDKFNKEYRYNIRHGYGLEGSRKNYQPKSCQQIITGPVPASGQVHGCPFRHWSEANLQASLQSTYKVSAPDTKAILASVKQGHYHVACTRLFEIQHAQYGIRNGDGLGNGDNVDHPNKYFDHSRFVRKQAEADARPNDGTNDSKVKMET
ncbi:DNA primase subunit pri2 [Microbotryomycetes sp. JL201]|nr:DNA primase subunit pri2 [Microbotryomycetes sp. JL201]